jgi:copper transport protein
MLVVIVSIGFGLAFVRGWSWRPAAAHAAFVRSEPPPGATLAQAPSVIRIWFAEPLETTFTGADLLDAHGTAVPGTSVSIAAEDRQQLILTLPLHLPDGAYTVAWRTLSAADGHTLQGYFGFQVGAGGGASFAPPPESGTDSDTARALTRGLALIGLAALLAVAPMILWIVEPAEAAARGLSAALHTPLRRYAALAIAVALLASVAALMAQAHAVAPDAPLPAAIAQTIASTRYGSLWLVRLLLLILTALTVVVALWGRPSWRQPALNLGVILAIALPLPFSLLSHAAAETMGAATAIAFDALHLFTASVWIGGLLILAGVLVPASRSLPGEERRAVLRSAIPRFSVIGLAAWGILIITGLYAAWLHVGTLPALLQTPYGQTLLLKGAILAPALTLAAFHFFLGWGGMTGRGREKIARTLALEAVLGVTVLLVVGRLIGLEPARETLASETPTQIDVPLVFATDAGTRPARLLIAPGAAGDNDFTLEVDGAPLPDGSEGVLRFMLTSQNLGESELRLPAAGSNHFHGSGAQLALPGNWRIEALVRKIGAFNWSTETTVPIGSAPPPPPDLNPAPLFAPSGIAGLLVGALGILAFALVAARPGVGTTRQRRLAGMGLICLGAGAAILAGSRLVLPTATPTLAEAPPAAIASPELITSTTQMAHDHGSPIPGRATPAALPGPGTPVSGNGMVVTIAVEPNRAGTFDVVATILQPGDSPMTGARVAILSDMPAMGGKRVQTSAVEQAPGRYVAEGVELGMAGEWRITVRVSPKEEPTHAVSFSVTVP